MATGNATTWRAMESKLAAMGYVRATCLGEPRSEIQSGLAAIVPVDGEVDETTLGHPRERHRVILRLYKNLLEDPQGQTELELDQFRADLEEDFFGDFTLGGSMAYALADGFRWEYGNEEQEKTKWRTVSVTLEYRVDDRAPFAPGS